MLKKLQRLLPFIILVILILVVYFTNIHNELSLSNLREQQGKLKGFVDAYPILSPLIYISFYILSVILIIPDSTVLTIIGGFVFPLPLAVTYAVLSETIGATLFFAIFYNAFSPTLIEKEKPLLKKLRNEFTNNTASYLLFLRLSHIFPFWLINVFAAYYKVRYKTFIWTCLIGVIPFTFVMAEAGHSLSDLFKTKTDISIHDIFTTQVKIALVIIAVVALIPIVYKHIRQKFKK